MEPDRYWLLYFGLFFMFVGSRTGQAVCYCVSCFVRACFHLTLALLEATAAIILHALSVLLLRGTRIEADADE